MLRLLIPRLRSTTRLFLFVPFATQTFSMSLGQSRLAGVAKMAEWLAPTLYFLIVREF